MVLYQIQGTVDKNILIYVTIVRNSELNKQRVKFKNKKQKSQGSSRLKRWSTEGRDMSLEFKTTLIQILAVTHVITLSKSPPEMFPHLKKYKVCFA